MALSTIELKPTIQVTKQSIKDIIVETDSAIAVDRDLSNKQELDASKLIVIPNTSLKPVPEPNSAEHWTSNVYVLISRPLYVPCSRQFATDVQTT